MNRRMPFVAVVGQEPAKRALLLAAVEPLLGGVLLRGDKGSAKTTLARGLAALLPGDAPFVELPLGAGEDRVLGSLDLTELLTNSRPTFRPGILAAAHGGVLYVDEINLLADHLVDALLDVSASGVNRVERDGLSHTHPARFVLVASMNPEEGELRPQLLDRFGLSVDVRASADVATRAEAVRRQLVFDRPTDIDPHDGFDQATAELRTRIERARVTDVTVDDDLVHLASSVALDVGAEGLRADLMLVRAARANAALEDRSTVTSHDLRSVAEAVLAHRRRRRPFEQPGVDQSELDDAFDRATPPAPEPGADDAAGDQSDGDRTEASGDEQQPTDTGRAPDDRIDAPTPTVGDVTLPATTATGRSAQSGRGATTDGPRGRAVRTTVAKGEPADPLASAVALATRRAIDRTPDAPADRGDLRSVMREHTASTLIVFVVDASGSMGVEHRMSATKAAVIGLLADAYRRRCRVAIVSFRDDGATTVLRPTASVEVAKSRLTHLHTGGTSPIGAGLAHAAELIDTAGRDHRATIVLVTDGRASTSGRTARDAISEAVDTAATLVRRGIGLVVVDSEAGPTRLGFARDLADRAGGALLPLDQLATFADTGIALVSGAPTI